MTNAPSTIASIAAANRASLLARDAALLTQLRSYYAVARRDLTAELDKLIAQVEAAQQAGTDVSAAWLRRQSRYVSLVRQIDVQLQAFADYAAPRIEAAQSAAATLGLNHASQLLEVSVGASFDRLPVSAVEHLTGVLSDGSPLSDVLSVFGKDASKAAKETLVSGLVRGKSPRATAVEVRKVLDTTAVRALTISRTETLRAYRTASALSYRENADILSGHRWLCAKSDRTCLSCLSLDGTILDLDEFMPVHPNCRCTTIPVLKDGPPIDIQTGSEWFDQQDAAVQERLMGRAAHQLFKDGTVQLADFQGTRDDPKWGKSTYQKSLREVLNG